MATFKLTGDKEMAAKLRRYANKMPQVAARELFQEANTIITEAKTITPKDTGALANSGIVLPAVGTGANVKVRLGMGQNAEAYALAVHEHPSGASPPSWRNNAVNFTVGGPKFFERPVLARIATLGQTLAKAFRAELKRLS